MTQSEIEDVKNMLRTAFYLGQEYWRYSDSDSRKDWERGDVVADRFADMVEAVSERLND